jgi:hypothetical protein
MVLMKTLVRLVPLFVVVTLLSGCGSPESDQAKQSGTSDQVGEAGAQALGANADLVAEFNVGADMLLASLEGLTTEQWTFRESEDRWSIAEVCEHIVIAEQIFVGGFINDLVSGEPNAELEGGYQEMDEGVRAFIRDRTTSLQASEALQPTGAYSTPEEGIAAFREVRAQTLEFLEQGDIDFRQYTGTPFPEAVDPMDAHQWLLFAAGHVERHTQQIEQVKVHEGYPAG